MQGNHWRNPSAWGLAGLIVAGLVIYFWVNREPALPRPTAARAPRAPAIESIPGGPQTPEYDRLQRLADQQRAARALDLGGSAAPTPPRLHPRAAEAPIDPAPGSAPPPPPVTPARSPGGAPPDDSAPRVNDWARAMRDQLKGLIAYRERFEPTPTRMVVFEDRRGVRERATPWPEIPGALDAFNPPGPRDRQGPLRPGDLLYAVLQTAINSDEPGPIRALIVGERFKGSILLGSLTSFPPVVGRRPERVLVKFDHLTTPERVTYAIEAYAVDTTTARTALATGVDHHRLERWGALLAASFLEGYGQAVRASHTITTVGPLGNIVSVPQDDLDHADLVREAVGTVGQRLATVVGEQFQRPNTITVASGAGIGVLIIASTAPEPAPRVPTARNAPRTAASVTDASVDPPPGPDVTPAPGGSPTRMVLPTPPPNRPSPIPPQEVSP